MKLLLRWGKFNLVGAVGMGFQLAVVALVARLWPGHYLAATAVAIELTLLHNFVWHWRFTWRDRRDGTLLLRQCLRFHAANGAVSMSGNFALLPLLYRVGHMPLVAADAVAILACSLVNFVLGERWAFAAAR